MTIEEILKYLSENPQVQTELVSKLNEGKLVRTQEEEAAILAKHLENNLSAALRDTDKFGKEISARTQELRNELDGLIKTNFGIDKAENEKTSDYASRAAQTFKESHKTENARVKALEEEKATLAAQISELEGNVSTLNGSILEKDFDGEFRTAISGKKVVGIPDANQEQEIGTIREIFSTRYRKERGEDGKLRFFKGDELLVDKDQNPLDVAKLIDQNFGYKFAQVTEGGSGTGGGSSQFSAVSTKTREDKYKEAAEKGLETGSAAFVDFMKAE